MSVSGNASLLVRGLEEAYQALAIYEPAFEALQTDAATRLEGVALSLLAAIDARHGARPTKRSASAHAARCCGCSIA